MSSPLGDVLLRAGAVVDGASGRALHFGEPARELWALRRDCAVVDQSHLDRLVGTGPDLRDLLQRLGTADLRDLEPGGGRPTVLTSPKGRIVERLFVQHLGPDGLLLVGGAGTAGRVLAHLGRYAFAERLDLRDHTPESTLLGLLGPRAAEALGAAGFEPPPPWGVTRTSHEGRTVYVLGHDGLTGEGYSLLLPREHASSLWPALVVGASRAGGRAAGESAVETWRVLRGVPAPGHELTEDYNPLEAGQEEAISFSKGCYVGQEVVARLKTYDKVSRELVGLQMTTGALPVPGAPLFLDETEVGRVTTAVVRPDTLQIVALAYLKRRVAATDVEMRVGAGGATARRVSLPFPD